MKVAILGINTLVGQAMLQSLNERSVECDLKLITLDDDITKNYKFKGEDIQAFKLDDNSFVDLDYVLGALNDKLSLQYAQKIVDSKAIYIDASSAFRKDINVPLVVPEINGEDVLKTKGIIANPNCTTVITCMAVIGMHRISPINAMVVTSCQAASGAGVDGMRELANEMKAIVNKEEYTPSVFPQELALNLIPCIGIDTNLGYTTEEMKMQDECRRILHDEKLKVSCTAIRSPIVRSHGISVLLYTEDKIELEDAIKGIQGVDDVELKNDLELNIYPTPLQTTNQDIVMVGRVRPCLIHDNGINLFCCGDQIRKGTATNCVEILQKCMDYKLK